MVMMELLLFGKFLLSFLIAFYLIPKLIRVSNHYKMYDIPDNRKTHFTPVPFLGGVALYIAFHLTQHLNHMMNVEPPPFMELFGFCVVGNTLIGLGDDFFDYHPTRKFLVQFFLCAVLLYFVPINLPFDAILPLLKDIPFINNALSILVLIGIINSFNLIDGMDGLAVTLALVTCTAYLILFKIENNIYFLSTVLSISGALIAFLFYNRPKAMIFMGDSGSFMVGSILGILTLVFISNGASENFSAGNRFQLGFALIAIPSLDMVRLFLWRIIQRKSPFVGDNLHIHHLLQSCGFSVPQTLAVIVLSQILLFIAAVAFQGEANFLPFLVITMIVYFMIIFYLKKRLDHKSGSTNTRQVQQES